MMNKSIYIFTILFTLFSNAFAQRGGTIQGTVTSADGKPVEAVTIGLANTTRGTLTNEKGHFTISKVKPGNYTIKVSAVGLTPAEKTVTVTAGATTSVNFMLSENASQLGEVAILGNHKKYKVDQPSPSLRLNEPLLQVPQNIQVVTNDQIKDQQIFNMLEGVSRNVSGVVMQEHWGNYAPVYGRGDRLSPFRNGFNIEAPWGPLNEDMAFVDRIEFVKGPAAFMLANGNPSGFYNVVTKKPTGVNRQSVEFTAGSFNTYRASADLDGTFTQDGKLQYRLNLVGQLSKSFRPYDFTNKFGVDPVLRYKFDDKNTLTAEYTYQYQRMNAFGTAYLFSTDGYKTLPRDFTNAPSNSPSTAINDHSAFLTYEHKFSDKWTATVQGAYFYYKQNGYSYWIDSILRNGNAYRSLGLWDAVNKNKFGQAFVSGEVKTGPIVHRILGGIDLGDKHYLADFNQSRSLDANKPFNIYNPNNGPAAWAPFDETTPLKIRANGTDYWQTYQSGYVQDELGFFNQKLRLTLAGRFTHAVTNNPYSGRAMNRKFTPRFGLSYSIDDATSIYGVYDQAFIPQMGRVRGGGTPDPITGNNIEGGIKRDWFNGKWSTSVSVYQIIKNNQLIADPDNPTSGLQIALGQTKVNGVEFDARGEITNGLNLMVNYAYTNPRITKNEALPSAIGSPIPGFAKHVTNAWLTYRLQRGELKGLGFSAGYQWQLTRYPWSLSTRQTDVPNYFRVDAGASYIYKKYSLALNVNNLLNAYLFSGGHNDYYSPQGATVYTWQAEAPRNVRVTVGYRF
ncbi:TonB-dependent receptor [Mucilaginibacter sp. RS28]|uniref:TonB-dependent receptor n=1 Tax=Mucilaginibacter straminoryzae TaxID=2932774 RepID=A0A9X2BBG0_9SPHI|nr:TonB-dependent receptor [Mucilaginibacter straminoryzae]MCJ8208188.1 TonB-dependent receptor [Mucilaginibacter straminoryzae]